MNGDEPDQAGPPAGGSSDALHMESSSPDTPARSVALCTGCHRPLDRVGLGGECLRCLSRFVWSPDATPGRGDSDRPLSAAGITHYGQFEVVVAEDGLPVELGAGAMAVTYQARDTVLHCEVALKVINHALAVHPDARARFLREARAAARLRHPNVASVLQYGEQGSECFYAMELVEGENLEARVRRQGPLPVSSALEVGVQVARALAAAEACGVIHRDLKPSNLMLANHGLENGPDREALLVKVIDWGLARAVGPQGGFDSNLTHGGFVGTPAFASPEQFRGGARLDSRSDIYSLGITLWYLLCGRVPFPGHSLEETRDLQATGKLPLEQLAAARVPGRVVALLKSMLAVDPAARPRSARELLEALRRCQNGMGSRLGLAVRRRRRLLPAAAALGGALVVTIGAWWWHERVAPAVPPSERSVAVLPFENLSPEAADAFFAAGVQDQIATDLARVASLKVIGSQSTREYFPQSRNLAKIGEELGVIYLLEGSVRRTEARVAVNVRLVNSRDPSHVWTYRYDRPLNDVFAVQNEITHTVAERLQVTLTPGERAAVSEPPTSDLVAYDLYLRAREGPTLTVDDAAERKVQQRKVTLLEKAVERDPNFFLAYCDLARAHDVLQVYRAGATAEELTVDHRAIAESYLAIARRLRPNAGELHLAQASHLLALHIGQGLARTEVNLARQALPNNSEVEELAGDIARFEGRWEDVLRSYEQAFVLDPRNHGTCYELARTYLTMRRYEDYRRTMTKVIAITAEQEQGTLSLEFTLGALEGQGDLAPLRAALAAFPTARDPGGQKKDFYNVLLSLNDHDPDTLSRVLAASKQTEFLVVGIPYPKAWYEGLAARMRGDDAGARTAFAAARPEVEKSVLSNPRGARLLSLLAMIDAGLGRPEAIDEAQRACALTNFATVKPMVGCNLAVVYAWLGRPDLACAELEKWVDQPVAGGNIPNQPTYGDLQLNPLWDTLRGNPRFDVLVQRLAPKEQTRDSMHP